MCGELTCRRPNSGYTRYNSIWNPNHYHFNEELQRLNSYWGTKYWHDHTAISPTLLAEQGFVYYGPNDLVRCHFCPMSKDDWRQGENVREIHKALNPTCPMVTGVECGNIPILGVPSNISREIGLPQSSHGGLTGSGEQGPLSVTRQEESMDVSDASSHASINNNSTSMLQSSQCASTQNQPSEESSSNYASHPSSSRQSTSSNYHSNLPLPSNSPANQLSTSSASSNQSPTTGNNQSSMSSSTTSQSSESNQTSNTSTHNLTFGQLNIITARPKRYEFAVRDKRLETFGSWPAGHRLTKEELVDAGFYYAGYADCGRCFYCGGGLRNWEPEDQPIVEHARWFPKCGFIIQQMGQDFVDAVARCAEDNERINLQMVADTLGMDISALYLRFGGDKKTWLKNDSAVKTIFNMGYSMDDIIPVATELKETMSSSEDFLSVVDLFDELVQRGVQPRLGTLSHLEFLQPSTNMNEDLRILTELKKSIHQLRQQNLCKVCLDKDVGVIFLECGHMACCTDCALAMKECPVCRKTIKGTLRGYLA